jgi:hypothetical protein
MSDNESETRWKTVGTYKGALRDRKYVKPNYDITHTSQKFVKHYNNKNYKTILCRNIVTYGKCDYGNECLYAHSLNDQNIEELRQTSYNMITVDEDLSHIDLKHDYVTYRALLELTKICDLCAKNKCPGGHNCKHGTRDSKYHICARDLDYGDCTGECGCVHLTKKGLKPRYIKPIVQVQTEVYDEPHDDTKSQISWGKKLEMKEIPTNDLNGTLLTLDFFKKLKSYNDGDDLEYENATSSDISSDDEQLDECNVSIFS